MRGRKNKIMQRKPRGKIVLFALTILFAFAFIWWRATANLGWWNIDTDGEIYQRLLMENNRIYFGNNQGYFYALDKTSGKILWQYKTDHEIASDPVVFKNTIIITSLNGILYSLDKKSGAELWRFESSHFFSFGQPLLSNGRIYIADTNGGLYAINASTGRLFWNFQSKSEKQPALNINNDFYYFLSSPAAIADKKIYYSGTDGFLYALNISSGTVIWRYNTLGKVQTQPIVSDQTVFVATNFGDTIAVNQRDGHLLWKQHKTDSAITCLQKYQARDLLSFPFLAHPARFVQTFWLIAKNNIRSVLVAVGDKGKISLLNSKGGAVVWETEELGLKTTCPQYLDAKLYFGSLNSVFATAITDGKQSLITNYGDGYFFKPIPSPYNDTLRTIFPFLPVSLFVGDAHGKLHAFSPAGKELWEFSIFGAVNKNLLFDNTYVYFSGTDGAVYRINRDTGVPPTPNKQVAVNQQMSRVGLNNIEEITIHFDDRWYSNPWKDIKVSAQFIHESGTKFVVDGFYYDKNIWKIRFNPPIKGKWNWQLSFEAPGNTKHYSGSFVSTTDTTATFIKIYDKNPKRFTLDNKTIFNGIGIGDAIFDRNLNGSPLDDWFTEDTETDASASGTKSGNYYTDNKMNLDQYLSAYGSQGKFNMFRWSVNNASFNLWRNFSINNKFLITEGKYGDELARSLKNHGFQIWLTVFSFDIPFAYQYPNELKAMRQYIRYIVARYGPYVSVWEISNEAYAPEALVQFIAQEIRAADIEKRPISMSHILPDMNEISIIAPHWYETENASVSDTQTVQKISTYQNYNKPVVFAEQGNATPDNPDDSGLRMRIRSWTAFFNEAILIFWNQSDQRVYSVGSYTNANLYIGAKERLVIANLQKFTQGVDVSAVTTTFLTDNPYVRAYGLDSNAGFLGYFYHYTDWELKTSFSTTVILSRDAVLSWYDPETGTTLQEQTLSSGANEIRSPKFSIDIALKVTYAPTN